MPIVAVNVIKVLLVIVLYGFLFYVARSMRFQLARPAAEPELSQEHAFEDAPPPAPERGPTLRIKHVNGVVESIELTGRVVVGRGEAANLQLADEFASDSHAVFWPEGNVAWVEDLGSTNGTKIDGAAITGAVEIPPGAEIGIGRTTVTIT